MKTILSLHSSGRKVKSRPKTHFLNLLVDEHDDVFYNYYKLNKSMNT